MGNKFSVMKPISISEMAFNVCGRNDFIMLYFFATGAYMKYKDAIRKLRLKMMLSQKEFAQKLGVSFATVNRWENNKFTPTYKAQRQLAILFKKYGIQIEE